MIANVRLSSSANPCVSPSHRSRDTASRPTPTTRRPPPSGRRRPLAPNRSLPASDGKSVCGVNCVCGVEGGGDPTGATPRMRPSESRTTSARSPKLVRRSPRISSSGAPAVTWSTNLFRTSSSVRARLATSDTRARRFPNHAAMSPHPSRAKNAMTSSRFAMVKLRWVR